MKKHHFDKVTYLSGNLKYNKTFQQAVKDVRVKWEIKPNGFDTFDEFKQWQQKLHRSKPIAKRDDSKAKAFEYDVKNLILKKLNLNPALDIFFVWFYVVMNEELLEEQDLLPKGKLQLSVETGGRYPDRLVVYNLHPFTSKEDWEELWSKVEQMKRILFSKQWTDAARRYRVMDNASIAKFIIRKKDEGLNDVEVAREIKKKFKINLRSETDVSKMKQRFLNKLNKDTLGNA